MGLIKRWNGSSWVDNNNNNIRRFNGSNWNDKSTVRRWNGSSWQVVSEQKHVSVWEANWTQSYSQDGSKQPGYKTGEPGRMYQGRYGNPDSYWYGNSWGRQRSLIGFPNNTYETLKGARIEKVELYLHNYWAWYWAGVVACIGVHNFGSEPDRFNHVRYGVAEVRYNSRNEGKWITFDSSVASMFASGEARGFTLLKESDNPLYYGYWYGVYGGAYKPKIRVTYYK